MDLTGAPSYILAFVGVREGQARDVLLRHRFLYYVKGTPSIPDTQYDHLEWFFRQLFPNNPIINGVGSDRPDDYPGYIQEGRHPNEHERHWHGGF
jgi:NAD-dependent DNA ligase